MNEQLTDFLIDLASDPGRCASFVANPVAALEQTDLSDVQRAALLAGDAGAIRRLLAAGGNGKGIKTAIRKDIKKKKPSKKKSGKKR